MLGSKILDGLYVWVGFVLLDLVLFQLHIIHNCLRQKYLNLISLLRLLPGIPNNCSAPQPNGAFCLDNQECEESCSLGVCSECAKDSDCEDGEFCRNKLVLFTYFLVLFWFSKGFFL